MNQILDLLLLKDLRISLSILTFKGAGAKGRPVDGEIALEIDVATDEVDEEELSPECPDIVK